MKKAAYKIEMRIIFPDQTPAQYAQCVGFRVVQPSAWEPIEIAKARKLVESGIDPNRIALFVVPR